MPLSQKSASSAEPTDASQNPWAAKSAPVPTLGATIPGQSVRSRIRSVAISNVLLGIGLIIVCPWIMLMEAEVGTRFWIVKYLIGIGGPAYGIYLIFVNIRYLADLNKHPALHWPSFGHPAQVAETLDQELAKFGSLQKVGHITLTPGWMVRSTHLLFDAVPLSEIAWAYQKVINNRSYGVTTSRTYSLMVFSCTGRSTNITNVKEKQVQELLGHLQQRSPWAVLGFSKEIERAWKSNREGFLQQVRNRRRDIQNGVTPETSSTAQPGVPPSTPTAEDKPGWGNSW